MTIGMRRSARQAAVAIGVAGAKNASTGTRASSRANGPNCSASNSAVRCSICRLRPSTKPWSARPATSPVDVAS